MLNERMENEKKIREFLDDVAIVLFYDRIEQPKPQAEQTDYKMMVLGTQPRYNKAAVY